MDGEDHTSQRTDDPSEFSASTIFSQEAADFSFLHPLKPTLLFTAFWRFAAERQRVFWRRAVGLPPPWTTDPVLGVYKFTNAYRASDRVSQFLIRSVIYEGPQEPRELFFRTVLFKLFNRIETWELLLREAGPLRTDAFCVERYNRVLSAALARGEPIYSAAYIMPSGGKGAPFARKHRMHLELLARMLRDELPERIAGMKTMARAFAALRTYPTIGDFLAYQYVTDLNYSTLTGFSETEFVVPGPGALSGLRKCFADTGRLTDTEVIRLVQERQGHCFAASGVTFPALPGRPLQLIDVQNLFCELDKYARVAYPQLAGLDGRSRIKQRFQPAATMLPLWYPPKWGINGKRGALLDGDYSAVRTFTFWKGMPEDTNDSRPAGGESKFPLGQTVITRTALATLPAQDIADALDRHRTGDWGEVGRDDWQANERSLKQGERLLSVYRTQGGTKFYVISEWDRSLTTVLLPEDY